MSKWKLPPEGQMDRDSGIYFQNMTMKELAERREKNDVIIIPIGSTETHGPGEPLGEDTFLCTRMAEEVARVTGCTVAQPMWYGSHPYHHLGMPGTVVIPEETFVDYIKAMIAGFWNAGFRKQILISGHAQEYLIPTAMHSFAKKYQVPAILIGLHWWHAAGKLAWDKKHGGPFDTGLVHACEVEASYSKALFPEMVKDKDLIDIEVKSKYINSEHFNPPGDPDANPIRYWSHVGCQGSEVVIYPEGSLGPSTKSSAEKAKPGVEAVMDYLEKLVNDIMKAFPPGKLPPVEEFTQKDNEEFRAVLKEPGIKGWKNLYVLGWPV
jgi:3-dehydro-scyllo-inosose hydrolase